MLFTLYLVKNVLQNILYWLKFDTALWQKHMATVQVYNKKKLFIMIKASFLDYSGDNLEQECVQANIA